MTESVEISQEAFAALAPETYVLVDMRDAATAAYGKIPRALAMPEDASALPRDRQVILYCSHGQFSLDKAEELRQQGVNAYSLEDGYLGWLMRKMQRDDADAQRCQQIEESIRKTYHKRLFSKFA